jgi:thiol-disulfide isomerase/thioredoxin
MPNIIMVNNHIQKSNSVVDIRSLTSPFSIIVQSCRFYAPWCKSCQKFGILYQRLALERGCNSNSMDMDTTKNLPTRKDSKIRFAEMQYGGTTAEFCRQMGIRKLPNIHIYHNKGHWMTGFPCGPAKFSMLEEILDRLSILIIKKDNDVVVDVNDVNDVNDVDNHPDDEWKFITTLQEGSDMMTEILRELRMEYENTMKIQSSNAP